MEKTVFWKFSEVKSLKKVALFCGGQKKILPKTSLLIISDEKALTEKGARKISMLKKKQYNPDKDQESRSVSRKYCKNLYKKQESRKHRETYENICWKQESIKTPRNEGE